MSEARAFGLLTNPTNPLIADRLLRNTERAESRQTARFPHRRAERIGAIYVSVVIIRLMPIEFFLTKAAVAFLRIASLAYQDTRRGVGDASLNIEIQRGFTINCLERISAMAKINEIPPAVRKLLLQPPPFMPAVDYEAVVLQVAEEHNVQNFVGWMLVIRIADSMCWQAFWRRLKVELIEESTKVPARDAAWRLTLTAGWRKQRLREETEAELERKTKELKGDPDQILAAKEKIEAEAKEKIARQLRECEAATREELARERERTVSPAEVFPQWADPVYRADQFHRIEEQRGAAAMQDFQDYDPDLRKFLDQGTPETIEHQKQLPALSAEAAPSLETSGVTSTEPDLFQIGSAAEPPPNPGENP